MIRAIIFDCFGVLTADNWQIFIDSLAPGANVSRAREAHRAYDAGTLTKAETAAAIVAATGKSFTEIEDFNQDGITKNNSLLAFIEELRGEGYKTGILSNIGSDWIRSSFLDEPELGLFDEFIFSFEVGLLKPDPRMYNLAAEKFGLTNEQIVFVDDKERYSEAARATGMKAVTYQSFTQFKDELQNLLNDN